jgi:hypothetical protein
MENTHSVGQDRIAAAAGAIIFFLPILMGVRTPFVIKYMKQGFLLNLIGIISSLVGSVIWGLGFLLWVISIIAVGISFFLAFQAYSGREYTIEMLYIYADKVIQTLGIQKWFAAQ